MYLKPCKRITLLFIVMILGLFLNSVSAERIEEGIWVGPKKPYYYEFTVKEPGTIYAEVVLEKSVEEPILTLTTPKGTIIEGRNRPLSLEYEVSEKELENLKQKGVI